MEGSLMNQNQQLAASETEAAEREAMKRFLAEALGFSQDRIAALSDSPNGLSWCNRRDAWNYHDECWEEYEKFSLCRIPREEFEKNRFQDRKTVWSYYERALKRWNPQAEYYCHSSFGRENGWRRHVEKIYLAEIPGCAGPVCLEYEKGNDRD